ncbi:type II toxin-antitoxin system VapC family toxin [Niveispirillum sp. KHB5.9]|uniref:type II toxin-antitoxin system VapC family toxin n=1 Tax=Niveispirillum sp. KHB5.9 TaxID=3400269 RepID=UPI003A8A40ED
MNYLVDSHIIIWLSLTPEKVPAKVRAVLAEGDATLLVSVASLWEIAIKHAAGRLHFPMDRLDVQLADMGTRVSDITLPHALAAAALPPHHNDPFDRMLIAQARMEALVLVTADGIIPTYDVKTLSARM